MAKFTVVPWLTWPLLYTPSLARPLRVDQVRTVFEFPKGTYVENLAVRANGQVLVTPLTEPNLLLIDPQRRGTLPTLVYTFPEALGLAGITEY